MNNSKKRLLSVALAFCITGGYTVIPTFASDDEGPELVIYNVTQTDEKTSISVKVENPDSETESGILMAALYNEDGTLGEFRFVQDGTAEFSKNETGYIKAFLWSGMKPVLSAAYSETTPTETEPPEETEAPTETEAPAEPQLLDLSEAVISGSASYQNTNGAENAFDGSTDTFFDGLQNGYCIANLRRECNISSIRFYPRGGRSASKPAEYVKRLIGGKFYGSADVETWTELYTIPSDVYTSDTDTETLKWHEVSVNANYRYIKYENTEREANIAEIELYGTPLGEIEPEPTETPTEAPVADAVPENFEIMERTGWTAETNSAQDTRTNGTGPERVLDGDTSTIWHSKYDPTELGSDSETNPIYIMIDTGAVQSISGIRYTPRERTSASGSVNGVITAYEVYVSDDKETWTKAAEGNMGYTSDGTPLDKNIIFNPVEARYVKLNAKDNLSNSSTYMASCAELNLLKYTGEESEHPMKEEAVKLAEIATTLENIDTEHPVKEKLISKASELKTSGSVDSAESFIGMIDNIIDALTWSAEGINDVYINRLLDILADSDVSSLSVSKVVSLLDGFYVTGEEAAQTRSDSWQNEFSMSDEELTQPLYLRIQNAISRAKARIDSGDGKDYKMLKELVSYLSGKYEYEGYENSYGMNADSCEAAVSNINFTLANLEKMDKGELSTELTQFESGELWLDDKGSKISAHGGQIIKSGDTYYWYGEDNKIAYSLTTGVSCYSSKDLKNWTYEGQAFRAFDDGTEEQQFTKEFLTDSILGTAGRIERPKVIYNEKNDNYVMWMHLEKNGRYDFSAMGVAVSDSPTGPFVWQWYGRPVCDNYVVNGSYHQFFRDMNLFVDEDKKAYLFVSSENNQVMYVIRLNENYTWIDADDLESSGTTEDDIAEGKVIIPDMRIAEGRTGGYVSGDYTYGKKAFTRYQLASGGAAALTQKTDDDGNKLTDEDGNKIYVSTRKDGLLSIPEYSDGRWSRLGQNIAEENRDTGATETIVNNSTTLIREAPAPVRANGKYYLVTSGASGWRANPSLTQMSDSVLGTWTATGNPMTGNGPDNNGRWSQNAAANTSFNSQSTCILQLPDGQYMYMGDRWKNGVYDVSTTLGTFPDVDVKISTYVWLPITFETDSTYGDNTLKVRWSDAWTYSE